MIGGKANSIVGHSLFGAVTGGVVSNMQGGNFWEGAAIGLTVGLLNHAGKKLYPSIGRWLQKKDPPAIWDINGDGKLQKNEADEWGLNHGGTITVDGNKIDIKGFNVKHTTFVDGNFSYGTTNVFKDLPFETAATYGGSNFKLLNGRFQMQSQRYHYDMQTKLSVENVRRNLLTIAGYPARIVNTPVGRTVVYFERTFQPFMINVNY